MLQEDYIMRILRQATQALATILRLKQAQQFEGALSAINQTLKESLGLNSVLVNSLSAEDLIAMMSFGGTLQADRLLLLAMLLKEEGDIYAALGQSDTRTDRYIKSLKLLLVVLVNTGKATAQGALPTVESLVRELDDDISIDLKRQLFQFYEKVGRYDAAEDYLFDALYAEENGEGDVLEQGIAFYGRLLPQSDEALLAGNLPRAEVLEGLAELGALAHSENDSQEAG